MRKLVLVPVLVVAVGIAGFEGYGAYTRSKPVDYSRGGGDFAALPSATASPTAGTPSASAVPGRPAATPTRSPLALPRTEATAAPQPVVTTAPSAAPAATAAPLVVPRTGT